MPGKSDRQAALFVAAIDLWSRGCGRIRRCGESRMANEDLAKMSQRFDAATASEGRPSVPQAVNSDLSTNCT